MIQRDSVSEKIRSELNKVQTTPAMEGSVPSEAETS